MSKKKETPDFVLDYEKHLRKSALAINSRVSKGETIMYAGYKVINVIVVGFKTSGSGTSEAYVLTEGDKKWDAGSEIFRMLTLAERKRILD